MESTLDAQKDWKSQIGDSFNYWLREMIVWYELERKLFVKMNKSHNSVPFHDYY